MTSPLPSRPVPDSQGWRAGRQWYPAVPADAEDIGACPDEVAHSVAVHEVGTVSPLRPGYDGMILAAGQAGLGAG